MKTDSQLFQTGRVWWGLQGKHETKRFVVFSGQTNATFCPHGYGCRSLVVSEDQIILDVTDNDLTVVVRVPEGKQLWLVSLTLGNSLACWTRFQQGLGIFATVSP